MSRSAISVALRSRLKVRQLATLVAIADAGSLRRAALALGVSQPALSKALRELEAGVGRRLFIRSQHGLAATLHGTAMVDYSRRLLRDVDTIAATIEAIDTGAAGRLRLGVIPYVSSDWLRTVAASLVDASHPVALRISEGATDGLLDALRRRELDCAVVRITPQSAGDDLVWRPLFEQTLRIVVRTGHPLLRRGARLALDDLTTHQWLLPPASTPTRQLLDQVFAQAGLPPPRTRLETYSLPIIENFVGNGQLLAAVPHDIARQFERGGRIKALPLRWPMPPICLAWLAGNEPSPLIERFEKAALAARNR